MKKATWLIVVLGVVLAMFYGRLLFIPETIVVQSSISKPAESAAAAIDFPTKDRPLVLPAYEWPPFTLQEESGRWAGADNEIIETVLNRMGYRVEWLGMPFARALEEMKSGKYPAMSACVIGGGREEFILFSDPVAAIYSVLWKMEQDPRCWSSYDDLNGRLIGASNYHYGAGFFEAAEAGKFKLDMVAAKSPEVVHFRKLLEGRTDMFICERSVGFYLKEKFKPEFDQVVPCETGVGPARPFSFAISRKYFAGREGELLAFVDAFNRELLQFSMEGGRQNIYRKYHVAIDIDHDGRVIIPGSTE